MDRIAVEIMTSSPISHQAIEMAERKGLGHPDTICDLLAEEISRDLCEEYRRLAGRVLYHNIENAFLVAGRSEVAFGGGKVHAPMRFVYGDRATTQVDGKFIPVSDIAETAARRWFRKHLPLLEPERHIVFQSELHAGSVQLASLFERETIGANDTCIGSGFYPLSETESLIVTAERFLNSAHFQKMHPKTGPDVKVTGVRRGRRLDLVISLAFVDRHVLSESDYFDAKRMVEQALAEHLRTDMQQVEELVLHINTADRAGEGVAGIYLTVLGTSADGADGGEVGRGNRPCGLNAFGRPLAAGAVAGKNPTSNVGKIYNLFAQEVAGRVHAEVPGIEEVYVALASQIGEPLDRPLAAVLRLVPSTGASHSELTMRARAVMERELTQIYRFTDNLVLRPRQVC